MSYGLSDDLDLLRRERPHARSFIDPFVGLLLARSELVESLAGREPYAPAAPVDPARLGQGAPLEPRDAFPLDPEALKRTIAVLQPVLTAGFREVRTDLIHIGLAAHRDADFSMAMAAGMLTDKWDALMQGARQLAVEPKTLGFWCIQMLTPLALARGRLLAGRVAGAAWNRGYCPVCGSWPSLARVRGAGRDLTCSFCGVTWRFERRECPYCEAPGPAGPVFGVPGFEAERVGVCRRCNHYLAELDGNAFADLNPEVAALVVAPLELLARQHGHTPATMDWRQMVWL